MPAVPNNLRLCMQSILAFPAHDLPSPALTSCQVCENGKEGSTIEYGDMRIHTLCAVCRFWFRQSPGSEQRKAVHLWLDCRSQCCIGQSLLPLLVCTGNEVLPLLHGAHWTFRDLHDLTHTFPVVTLSSVVVARCSFLL